MKKISRHAGPFGRSARFCFCCYQNGNSRRERKWQKRLSCEENGIELPRPVKRKRKGERATGYR